MLQNVLSTKFKVDYHSNQEQTPPLEINGAENSSGLLLLYVNSASYN